MTAAVLVAVMLTMTFAVLREAFTPEPLMPVHRPAAPDAPIPGRHWYSACDPDRPRVNADGVCEGCGESACSHCGHEVFDGLCACP
jgi:hypothetical protein